MTNADVHAQCGSLVRIALKDLNGPFGGTLSEIHHPATAALWVPKIHPSP